MCSWVHMSALTAVSRIRFRFQYLKAPNDLDLDGILALLDNRDLPKDMEDCSDQFYQFAAELFYYVSFA